jgi:hypothetical protein
MSFEKPTDNYHEYEPSGDLNVQRNEAERLKEELEALWLQLPTDREELEKLFAEGFKPGWEGRKRPFQELFDKVEVMHVDDESRRKAYRALVKDFQEDVVRLRDLLGKV